MSQYIQQIQDFVNLLQYGAWAAIIGAALMVVVLICVISLEGVVPLVRQNNKMLQEMAKRMDIPIPPL